MHTFEGKGCRIHYNSDMSGGIHICDKNINKRLVVEAQDILDFVADYVKNQKINALEWATTEEILQLEDDDSMQRLKNPKKYYRQAYEQTQQMK